MKLKFDSNLPYQQEAIASVTDLFAGLTGQGVDSTLDFGRRAGLLWNELGIGNIALPSHVELLKNLHAVQIRNRVSKSRALIESGEYYSFPNFSVEMETGTGKTYVHLAWIRR